MIKKGLSFLSLACIGGSLLSCQTTKLKQEPGQELVLTNNAAIELTDKAIAVKRSTLSGIPEGDTYPLLLTQAGDTVASQLDDLDGDNQWDELFFVTNLPANGKQTLKLTWVTTQPDYTKRTSVRFGKRAGKKLPVEPQTSETMLANQVHRALGYQPYQTDGPTWENDKVGFRHYLDGRNAKDLFGKKVAYMSPDSVGISKTGAVEDNYHVMKDWGRDIMAVGSSAGIGGIAMQIDGKFPRLGITTNDTLNNVEKTTFRIVTEGPVRSKIQIGYQNWKPADTNRSYTLQESPTIWPGMYAYQNNVTVTEGLRGDETLLVSMNNLDPTFPLEEMPVDDNWMVIFTHDRETYNQEWLLPLALILPKSAYQGYTEAPKTGPLAQAYFAKLKVEQNKPLTYYAVGTWEVSDERFRDLNYFKEYVRNLARQLSAEVDVQVK